MSPKGSSLKRFTTLSKKKKILVDSVPDISFTLNACWRRCCLDKSVKISLALASSVNYSCCLVCCWTEHDQFNLISIYREPFQSNLIVIIGWSIKHSGFEAKFFFFRTLFDWLSATDLYSSISFLEFFDHCSFWL